MKITRINIKEFRQFKDLELDFTYPEGHEKAGQPLDKVCFIGQSGTGKTTLLDLIYGFAHRRFNQDSRTISIGDKARVEIFSDVLAYSSERGEPNYSDVSNAPLESKVTIYLKSELQFSIKDAVSKATLFPKKMISAQSEEVAQQNKEKEELEKRLNKIENERAIELGDNIHAGIWEFIFRDIIKYDAEVDPKLKGLFSKAISENLVKLAKEFQEWKETLINPRKEIADNCLNPLLHELNLEVNIDNSNSYITLRHTKLGDDMPSHLLSTGVKQIILTCLPIYSFNTDGTVILFDEPERSLFPNIQQKLVAHYTSLAPNAQFFFATHSPMVAASFEPYERFILDFDEQGYVTSESCHRGIAPIGDDPNDLLRKDFGLQSLLGKEGIEAWERYIELKMLIRSEKDETKKMELVYEHLTLGEKYNFPTTSQASAKA